MLFLFFFMVSEQVHIYLSQIFFVWMASSSLDDIESYIVSSSLNLPDFNSNQCLCFVQLNDFDYLLWLMVMSLALSRRSIIKFINKSNIALDVKYPQYKLWLLTIRWFSYSCSTLWNQTLLKSLT
jgi:hypothetical protein